MGKMDPIGDFAKYIGSVGMVALAYLFGSTVEGKGREPADVDVALLYDGTLDADGRLRLKLDAAEKAEGMFGRRADVVLLNDASPFLRYQVLKHGKLIYESKRGADGRLKFDVMTEYFDALALQNFFYARRTPFLGMVTLKVLGLMLNPLIRKLLPMRMMMA